MWFKKWKKSELRSFALASKKIGATLKSAADIENREKNFIKYGAE